MTTDHTAPRRSSRRRLSAIVLAAGMLAAVVVGLESPARGAVPSEFVMMHAVRGVGDLDVYLDGALIVPNFSYGSLAGPFAVGSGDEHEIELFVAVAGPASNSSGRTDDPLEAGRLGDQPRDGAFAHVSGPFALRVEGRYDVAESDRDWFIETAELPFLDECDPEFAIRTISADADKLAVIQGTGGSGGALGGGAFRKVSRGWSDPIVFLGYDTNPSAFSQDLPPFGSFDFGTIDFEVGLNHHFFAFGERGEFGAGLAVVDCRTDRIVEVRTVPRSPTYGASRFVPVAPIRLFDTRTAPEPSGPIPSGGQLDVQVTGEVGIPATGVTAVVMNVTATATTGRGHVRAWPTGARRPNTASLNVARAGETIPNLVTVPVGAGGKVSFFALTELDLVADVAGYYVEATEATTGRLVPVGPTRAFDTRTAAEPSGPLAPDATLRVQIAGDHGVPAAGASAVVINLTGLSTGRPGFVTAYPGGTAQPTAANLNLTGSGDVAPNLAIVPLGDDGSIELYSKGGAHLVGDVFGYFTDESAASSGSGLFVPSWPTRIRDTRGNTIDRLLFPQFVTPLEADTSVDVLVSGIGDLPAVGVGAVLVNLTGTQAVDRGFATLFPKGQARPEVANLNLLAPGATRPNAALVPIGADGDISLYTKSGMHAVLDIFGYYTE